MAAHKRDDQAPELMMRSHEVIVLEARDRMG
jgi:monoamine oxidase